MIYISDYFLFRLFTNSLMSKFNMKGKGKKGKKALESTKIYAAIQGEPWLVSKWTWLDKTLTSLLTFKIQCHLPTIVDGCVLIQNSVSNILLLTDMLIWCMNAVFCKFLIYLFELADGVMMCNPEATQESIRRHAAEHLKHAPQRTGRGGFQATQS